jgi:NTE family protein
MKKIFLTFFIVQSFAVLHAREKPFIRNLVFEGAGIRGIAYCGAISELEENNLMKHVEKVGGTSAGAIVALTVALGYSGNEIQNIIKETNFRRFNDGGYSFIGGLNRMNKYFGWYRGIQFENWLEKIIADKTHHADITFQEMNEMGFKDLFVTGTCLNKQRLVIFSRETYPNMKIKDAIRISMSIPLYFEAVFIDKQGKVIPHPKQKDTLDVMVDGGFTGNFPIHLFDSNSEPDFATLGFRIDSDKQIKNDRERKDIAVMDVKNFKQYVNAFYNIVIENLNRSQLSEDDWKRTVSISDGGIGPRIRKLSAKEINILLENGRSATRTYLN